MKKLIWHLVAWLCTFYGVLLFGTQLLLFYSHQRWIPLPMSYYFKSPPMPLPQWVVDPYGLIPTFFNWSSVPLHSWRYELVVILSYIPSSLFWCFIGIQIFGLVASMSNRARDSSQS